MNNLNGLIIIVLMSKNLITVEDIRLFILDNSIEDNALDMDLEFSDSEILEAMRRCAMTYNTTPPLIGSKVSPENFPYSMVFLHGVAYQLYLSKLHELTRNDIDYNAGGVSTNLVAKRIAHVKGLIQLHKEAFEVQMRELKYVQNANRAFRRY